MQKGAQKAERIAVCLLLDSCHADSTMNNVPLSDTDALFTIHSSAEHCANDVGASAVTGVCFVRDPNNHSNDFLQTESDGSGGDSDSDDESIDRECRQPLQFQCTNLLLGPQRNGFSMSNIHSNGGGQLYQHATHISAASHNSLSGAVLASCHFDGSCKLWDLATRRCIEKDICNVNPRGGPGLALRRLGVGGGDDASHQFLYQTRDPMGTVTLHDLNRPSTPLVQIQTHSTTFCALSPCHTSADADDRGAKHLVALPAEEHSVAIVRDLRCDPKGNPAWRVDVGDEYLSTMYGSRRKYGMLTSLALCLQETTQRIVLGAGMENGSALFYDLGAMGHGHEPWWINARGSGEVVESHTDNIIAGDITDVDSRYMCSATLGKDPVLCLDLVSSHPSAKNDRSMASLVAVGGCAGDADDLSELSEQEQEGTVSTFLVAAHYHSCCFEYPLNSLQLS